MLQSDGVLKEELPQKGVAFSKWQLTLAQLPAVGVDICGHTVVLLPYRVEAGEPFMFEETLILPSR